MIFFRSVWSFVINFLRQDIYKITNCYVLHQKNIQ